MTLPQSKVFPFLVSLLLVVNFIQAQIDSITSNSIVWHKVESLTPTIVTLPNNYDPSIEHTLIIALHGFGSTAEKFQRFSKPFTDEGFIYATPEAPYSYLRRDGTIGYEWFLYDISSYIMLERPASELEKAAMRVTTERQMDQVISDLREKYNVGKIFFMGMSQGGIITYLTGIHHHDKIDGMIIFGSVVDKDWTGKDNIRKGNGVRALVLQGVNDQAVPLKFAEQSRDLLLDNDYNVSLKKFDGGHVVPENLLPFVIDWINQE